MTTPGLGLRDFQPGTWVIEVDGEKDDLGNPKFVVDQTTGRRYPNDPNLRGKMFLEASVGLVKNTYLFSLFTVIRTIRVGFCYDCWKQEEEYKPLQNHETVFVIEDPVSSESPADEEDLRHKKTCLDRVKAVAVQTFKLATTPLTWLAMQGSACYGLCSPNDGRKLFSSIAKWQFGDFAISGGPELPVGTFLD